MNSNGSGNTANARWKCRLCGSFSPITESICTNPRCAADLAIYGMIERIPEEDADIPEEKTEFISFTENMSEKKAAKKLQKQLGATKQNNSRTDVYQSSAAASQNKDNGSEKSRAREKTSEAKRQDKAEARRTTEKTIKPKKEKAHAKPKRKLVFIIAFSSLAAAAAVILICSALFAGWKSNVLMDDVLPFLSMVEPEEAPVFGSSVYKRKDIRSVIFVKTPEQFGNDAWDVSEARDGSVMAWVNADYTLYIGAKGGVCAPKSCAGMFMGYQNAALFDFNNALHTDFTTDMSYMFDSCAAMRDLFDIDSFVTSSVIDMKYMFNSCESIGTIDISGFDTGNVKDMRYMFRNCPNLDKVMFPKKFDTSNVGIYDCFMDDRFEWEDLFQ